MIFQIYSIPFSPEIVRIFEVSSQQRQAIIVNSDLQKSLPTLRSAHTSMKKIYGLVSFLFLSITGVLAQSTPGVEWERCIPNALVTGAVGVSDSVFTVLYDIFSCTDSTAVGLRTYDGKGNLLWEKMSG